MLLHATDTWRWPYSIMCISSNCSRCGCRRSKAVMWGGLGLLMTQFSVFYWLTWYELSWDVMEPVAYFVSLGTAIAFYLFFLLTNETFDYRFAATPFDCVS